jgi:hypothetical protein
MDSNSRSQRLPSYIYAVPAELLSSIYANVILISVLLSKLIRRPQT